MVCKIHNSVSIYGDTKIGDGSIVMENVILGYPSANLLKQDWEGLKFKGVTIGRNAIIRSGTVIYCNVEIGDNFVTGHNVVIREETVIGNNVLVGTNTVIEGNTRIGDYVSIQSNVFVPVNTLIEDFVFLGPNVVLTNDKYPLRKDYELKGPIIRKGATIGANSVILPSVEIGEGAFIAAGSVVTRDVPPWSLAIGSPAKIRGLPDDLKTINKLKK
ncbi:MULTISPECIES: N-acetyltransferase [unclassified Archaeoglobus]|jgi:acetyltransferase-like isoleucine patch superfamily enzyme|uniref:N-acetyltransferase n=1 Tax=unclassified Archaeoglobus TaxID=2643606 RepID=UPI0025BB92CA|nr:MULTISPECIES: N-acetyltransferase [unclassified Archaeoglobus]